MSFRVSQANFSKGEVSEEIEARIDVAARSSALRKASNVIVMKYGGVTKRPGTRLVAEVYLDNGVRLIPFQFSLTQTYVLEMGQAYMRPAALGGLVLEDKLTIEAFTPGETTVLKVSYHAYSVGDQVWFDGVLGAIDINRKIARVTEVIDADHVRVDLDTSAYGAFTGDTGGTIRVGAPPPPPAPPPVPPPATPDPPPDVGGGGGTGRGDRPIGDGEIP